MPSSRWLKAVPSPSSAPEAQPAVSPNVSMGDLRRLEQEKRQKSSQVSTSGSVPQKGTPLSGMPDDTIPEQGIPSQGTPKLKSRDKTKSPVTSPSAQPSAERGYYATFNDLDDSIIPGYRLDPYEQSALRRLYRLSRGYRSLDCEVGLGALAKACNMARSKAQGTIASLTIKGLIRPLGHSQSGTKYRVLEQLPAVPPKGIPLSGIPQEIEGIPEEPDQGIPQDGNNKNNKDLIKTHTNTGGVRVGSRFTIEECRRYAQHLQSTGQGINNPGGYATTIHRTGEADQLIESFLNPTVSTQVDASQCPDCKGSGFYYPNGPTGGVAKCKHEKLTAES
jgi:hypothetical protein